MCLYAYLKGTIQAVQEVTNDVFMVFFKSMSSYNIFLLTTLIYFNTFNLFLKKLKKFESEESAPFKDLEIRKFPKLLMNKADKIITSILSIRFMTTHVFRNGQILAFIF